MKRGDRWVFRHPDAPDAPVYIEVTRVARDESWADIVCVTLAEEWRKRQPLPMPQHTEPYAWTVDDLEADYDRELNRLSAPWGGEAAREAPPKGYEDLGRAVLREDG